jgi:hypothetical protein
MMTLAMKHGFVCYHEEMLIKELSHSITSRMIQRLGTNVYQMAAYSLSCSPKATAERLFPEEYVTEDTAVVKTWKFMTVMAVSSVMSPTFAVSDCVCAGSTKSFRPKSSKVIRVVAKLLPTIEISHVILESGLERLYLNFSYALATGDGEVHWPKDSAIGGR